MALSDARRGASSRTRKREREREPELFFNRELSWLAFNNRVLEEATDPTTPLMDRLRFAIIVSSNLDEFFMVRVAALKDLVEEGDATPDSAGLTPRQQLALVSERAHDMVERMSRAVAEEIVPALVAHGIRIVGVSALDEAQRDFLSRHFRSEILPVLTPLAIDTSRPFPQLAGLSLNLAVLISPSEGESEPRLAVVQVPARLPRLSRPASADGTVYVPLEELIRAELALLFPGQTLLESAPFRVARDAELELDDEGGGDYVRAIEAELKKRRRGEVLRLEIGAGASQALREILMRRLGVEESDVYPVHGLLDIRGLQPLADLPSLEHLRERPLRPLPVLESGELDNLFETLSQRDVLLYHPYDSFDPVVALVRSAAADPDVLAIKQTLYRTSGDSPVVRALAQAAENGKQVTVLVELMARFDEQSNIRWARSLEGSGAHVIYGIRGYKTHAKICLVVRRGPQGIDRFVHLGTGNYNDRTARVYTDFGIMTSDRAIGEDASAFFNALTGYSDPPRMKKLAMAPTTLRERLLMLIERERRRASEGQAAEIRAKMNALVDEDIIRALYEASAAGVRIRLNVRGVCCLRPGIKGKSDTIEVVSVVDRFLEHARIAYFRNGGDEEVYLSSADWMPRNLDRRIELIFPVPPSCRKRVLDSLDAMFKDNVKGRWLTPDGSYRRKKPQKGEEPFRAQIELYKDAERAVVRARAAAGVVLEPMLAPGPERPPLAKGE